MLTFKDLFIVFNQQPAGKTSGGRQPKVIKAKVTAKGEGRCTGLGGGGGSLAPPMSSVVVERHQPVNKVSSGHL